MNKYDIISSYVNEKDISINIINELVVNKKQYLEFLEENIYHVCIENIKLNNLFWHDIIAIACAKIYNINIGLNNNMHIFTNELEPIHLYLYNNVDVKEEIQDIQEIQEIQDIQDNKKVDVKRNIQSKEINRKHILTNKWDLWIDNKDKKTNSDNWLDTITKIVSFNYVEDFWGVFNNIPDASMLNVQSDYYLFKENIIPCWEDKLNKTGGKMTIVLKKQRNYVNYELLDTIWINTVLGCIGENFNTDIITGVVLNIRKHQDRINIWTSSSDKDNIMKLGDKWKEILCLKKYDYHISFIKHDDNSINYIIT
jgi:translation initiation factor 4E